MPIKEDILTCCFKLLNNKILLVQKNLDELKESASNETKSTAGDKHETALAMLQIEQENNSRQLRDLLLQKLLLERIDVTMQSSIVGHGSLIKTNKGYLFISIGLGKVIVNNTNILCLSIESPLGQKLKGLKVNDEAIINNVTYFIENIQ